MGSSSVGHSLHDTRRVAAFSPRKMRFGILFEDRSTSHIEPNNAGVWLGYDIVW
jgi:hypothetical protein